MLSKKSSAKTGSEYISEPEINKFINDKEQKNQPASPSKEVSLQMKNLRINGNEKENIKKFIDKVDSKKQVLNDNGFSKNEMKRHNIDRTLFSLLKDKEKQKLHNFFYFLERNYGDVPIKLDKNDENNLRYFIDIINSIENDLNLNESWRKTFLIYKTYSLIKKNYVFPLFHILEECYSISMNFIKNGNKNSNFLWKDFNIIDEYKEFVSEYFIEGQKLLSMLSFNLIFAKFSVPDLIEKIRNSKDKFKEYIKEKRKKHLEIYKSLLLFEFKKEEHKQKSIKSSSKKIKCINLLKQFFDFIKEYTFTFNDLTPSIESRREEISSIRKRDDFDKWKTEVQMLSVVQSIDILIFMGRKRFKQLFLEKYSELIKNKDKPYVNLEFLDTFLFKKLFSIIRKNHLWGDIIKAERNIEYSFIDDDMFVIELMEPIPIDPICLLFLSTEECEYWLRLIHLYNPSSTINLIYLPYIYFCKNQETVEMFAKICTKEVATRRKFFFPRKESGTNIFKKYCRTPLQSIQISGNLIKTFL